VAGGTAELLTVFGRSQASTQPIEDVPLVSILRDTLGDSNTDNDRLRFVWVLSSVKPNLIQRALAALPFYYWRTDFGKNPDRTPAAVFDLAAPSHKVWTDLAGALTQAMALDPSGMLVRTSTRAYRNNSGDRRRMNLLEGVSILSLLGDQPEVGEILSEPELLEIQARLTLASKALGGLVDDNSLRSAYLKDRGRTEQMRGRNWELLRQRAEANGLIFEPFGLNGSATHALLWVARDELNTGRPFDGQYLGIADPYRDHRLRTWTGYTETREDQEIIPLALYSLEFPKVPLLMVDLRDTRKPKRREMLRRATADTLSGVLGISKWGNWPYLAGQWTWGFIHRRQGATNDRQARLRAYSQLRQWLALDDTMQPELRQVLQTRLETAGVNPLSDTVAAENRWARRQYEALLRYADAPGGLRARLDRDRRAELVRYAHDVHARTSFRLLSLATLGIYKHREKGDEAFMPRLDRERSVAKNLRFLEGVAQSSPQTELLFNLEEVRRALDALATSGLPARSADLLVRLYARTNDQETRELCQRALETLNVAAGGQ
jgi:hypothetical protein